MTRLLFVVLFSIIFFPIGIEAMGVTTNVLLRVKKIIAGVSSGTAFTIEVEKRQYIVTAKHVVASLKSGEKVQLCDDKTKCNEYAVKVIRCDDPIDIAVLVPDEQVTVAYDLPPELNGAVVGQDMFFVGYPLDDYDLTTNTGNESIGFIRKVVFSAQQRGDGFTRLYLDGRNNPGFSGSPVVYVPLGRPQNEFKVAAVVSGYRSGLSDVMDVNKIEKKDITPNDIAENRIVALRDGTYLKLTPSGKVTMDNTGIVIAYAIDHALEAIKKSKIKGPEVK